LDDFKALNDKYGHIAGDRILRSFANLIKETIRPSDVPARYGGEEFLIILPETSCQNALSVAERIRQKIALYPFEITSLKEKSSPFTISIGVCAFPGRGRTVEELITLADAGLYQAKKEGKNKVIAVQD
jgi:diguanylate cyclase (GGDEF)-like protein